MNFGVWRKSLKDNLIHIFQILILENMQRNTKKIQTVKWSRMVSDYRNCLNMKYVWKFSIYVSNIDFGKEQFIINMKLQGFRFNIFLILNIFIFIRENKRFYNFRFFFWESNFS